MTVKRKSNGKKRSPPLTPTQATATIRRIYLEGGLFSRTEHFARELANAGADMGDVEHVPEHGSIVRLGQWKPEHRAYNYDVVGTDIEGSELHVVACIDEENFRLILVTTF